MATVAAAAVALSSCTAGRAFRQPTDLQIAEPAEAGVVQLPMRLRWTPTPGATRFAVFVDRPPMRPGETLQSLVPSSDPCRRANDCLGPTWLELHSIHVTDTPALELDQLDDRRSNHHVRDEHRATVVALDADGHRMGERAASVGFAIEREA